jgi:hypothetical protein
MSLFASAWVPAWLDGLALAALRARMVEQIARQR